MPVKRLVQCPFFAVHDHRHVPEVLDPADVVNVCMSQYLQVDVGWRQSDQRQLPGRHVLRTQIEDDTEFVQPVFAGCLVAVVQILFREAGIDQHPFAIIGLDE